MGNDDRGQLLPMVALVMALGLPVLIVETARLVGERAIAQMAAANGAGLELFRQLGASVEVTVCVGRVRAKSRAVAVSCRGERCRPYAYP